MIKENQKYFNRLQILLDGICIVVSLLFTWLIRFRSGLIAVEGAFLPFENYLTPIFFIVPIYLYVYYNFKLYTPRRIKSFVDEFYSIIKVNVLGVIIFTLILFVIKEMDYSRYFLLIFGIVNVLLTTAERGYIRLTLRRIRSRGKNLKHIIFIGYSSGAREFINKIGKNKYWGYNVIGIFDDRLKFEMDRKCRKIYSEAECQVAVSSDTVIYCEEITSKLYSQNMIRNMNELEYTFSNLDIDEVFITLEIKDYDKIDKIIELCEKYGIRTQIIPDYFKYIPARPYLEEVEGIPVISTRYIPLDNFANKAVKRTFDIVVSLLSIVVFSPIMILTMAIIKLTSPGPVIFRQERVGMNKKDFVMYKFRSMKIQTDDEEKAQWTTKDDPRKTRFGEFIRKSSIDELPQLFNVLLGDMSLIGPRPERPVFVDKFKEEIPRYMVKHQIRPGMTGWAQVNGYRGDTSIKKRIEHDLYYIENWSLLLDIRILFLTILKGFINKNAY